jgi:hypothetical protein
MAQREQKAQLCHCDDNEGVGKSDYVEKRVVVLQALNIKRVYENLETQSCLG